LDSINLLKIWQISKKVGCKFEAISEGFIY
jgi:hypothetical protein